MSVCMSAVSAGTSEVLIKYTGNVWLQRLTYNDCVHCLAPIYNTVFQEEYEKMCPMNTKTIIVKEKCPWFNVHIIRARKKRSAA